MAELYPPFYSEMRQSVRGVTPSSSRTLWSLIIVKCLSVLYATVNPNDHFADGRLDNLASLEEADYEGYPNDYPDVHRIDEFQAEYAEQETITDERTWSLGGRITRQNRFGDFAFYEITDGTASVQIMLIDGDRGDIEGATEGFEQLLNNVDIGDILAVDGFARRSNTGELTLYVDEFTVISKTLQEPQNDRDELGESQRIKQRTPSIQSSNELQSTLQARFEMTTAIRQELQSRQFTEVETPILQQFANGAEATPFQTYCESLSRDMYLRIAPELYLKRLVVGGFDRVFEVARNFRNEDIDTTHNPEFTMLELYQTYADYTDMMALTEEVVATAAEAVTGDTTVRYNEQTLDFEPSWERAQFDELVRRYSTVDIDAVSDDELRTHIQDTYDETLSEKTTRDDMLMELYDEAVEPNLTGPVFVMDYPKSSTPLCKTHADDSTRVERFEAVVAGTELANAYTELIDPRAQAKRLIGQSENTDVVNEPFIHALSFGMPPTGGLGIGIDRLAMLLTDSQSIKNVLAFPLTTNRV